MRGKFRKSYVCSRTGGSVVTGDLLPERRSELDLDSHMVSSRAGRHRAEAGTWARDCRRPSTATDNTTNTRCSPTSRRTGGVASEPSCTGNEWLYTPEVRALVDDRVLDAALHALARGTYKERPGVVERVEAAFVRIKNAA